MKDVGIKPNLVTFNTMLDMHLHHHQYDEVLKRMDEMLQVRFCLSHIGCLKALMLSPLILLFLCLSLCPEKQCCCTLSFLEEMKLLSCCLAVCMPVPAGERYS